MPTRSRLLRPFAFACLLALGWIALVAGRAQAEAPSPTATVAPAPTISAPIDPVAAACAQPVVKKPPAELPPLWERLAPIALLLVVIVLVLRRLPRPALGHSPAFLSRRLRNWLPLGLTYSFLYMARYNLQQFMFVGNITEAQFGHIFGWGAGVYGISFLVNGPLADRWGGRTTILLAAGGAALSNAAMGYMVATGATFGDPIRAFTVLYGVNMYFQSFGAVSIVKVNGAWFHVRERGTFGGIFGILISLGLFLAVDVGKMITDTFEVEWLFFIPAAMLMVFFTLSAIFVRDTPAAAGLGELDVGDGSAADDGARPHPARVIVRMLRHPIILTLAVIELCSGFLRQAIFEWGRTFGRAAGLSGSFVFANWGVVNCIAGITGGMFAGAISDHLFQSRRGPVSAVLYAIMLAGAIAIVPLLAGPAAIPWVLAFMSMAIIGVHGMLSGTASADFGGKANTGVAVGIIDGFVYGGTALQAFIYGRYLPPEKIACADHTLRSNPAAKVLSNWKIWPSAMIPFALLGLVLALRLWNAKPKPRA